MSDAELIHDWHPLDGVPAPEYIPPVWIGTHVGLRLVEAMRTLTRLSIGPNGSGFGSAWPAYRYEWIDELAQASSDETQQLQEANARNWTKIIPSGEEIARMEMAIMWPARYLRDIPHLLRVVGTVAHARARYREMRWVAHRMHMPQRLVRRWNNEGLDKIARGLVCDDAGVF
jgi:hypothetical protein